LIMYDSIYKQGRTSLITIQFIANEIMVILYLVTK
jgi:hypothetical protein